MDPIPVILVAAGVVFLFAALVGGKLKVWKFIDVDVQSSRSKMARIISGCLGMALLILGIAVDGGLLESFPLSGRRVSTTAGIVVEPHGEFASVRSVGDFASAELRSEWRIVERDDQRWAARRPAAARELT